MEQIVNQKFLQSISQILDKARKHAKTAVNLSMVYAYYEIGKMIVEEEQQGENRAAYGKQLLKKLSEYLTEQFGRGYSVGNLKNIRQFYKVYSSDQIGETLFSQFKNLPSVDTGRKFFLSWSHYLMLMRMKNVDERHFYEIEAAKNDWSLTEFWNWELDLHLLDDRCVLPLTKNISWLIWYFITACFAVLSYLI